jgi:ribosomal protein L12E/L44/L45/RPP1/RPP2
LTSINAEVSEEKLTTLFSDLEGKNIHELLAKGENDLKSVVGVAGPSSGTVSSISINQILFYFTINMK